MAGRAVGGFAGRKSPKPFQLSASNLAGMSDRSTKRGSQGVPNGLPVGATGRQVKMMVDDIGIPTRVEPRKNGDWILVWELREERNRILRLDGATWHFGATTVQSAVKPKDFGLEEAKGAIIKVTEDVRKGGG